jgi:hypothetical protein
MLIKNVLRPHEVFAAQTQMMPRDYIVGRMPLMRMIMDNPKCCQKWDPEEIELFNYSTHIHDVPFINFLVIYCLDKQRIITIHEKGKDSERWTLTRNSVLIIDKIFDNIEIDDIPQREYKWENTIFIGLVKKFTY